MAKSKKVTLSCRVPEEAVEELERIAEAAGWNTPRAVRSCLELGLVFHALADLRANGAVSERDEIGKDYLIKQQAADAIIPTLSPEVREAIKARLGLTLERTPEDFEILIAWLMLGPHPSPNFG